MAVIYLFIYFVSVYFFDVVDSLMLIWLFCFEKVFWLVTSDHGQTAQRQVKPENWFVLEKSRIVQFDLGSREDDF